MPNGNSRNISSELDAIVEKYKNSNGFETAHSLRGLTEAPFQEALGLLPSKDFDFEGEPRHLSDAGADNDPEGGRVLYIEVLPGPTP